MALSLPLPLTTLEPAPALLRPATAATTPPRSEPLRGRARAQIWLALHFPDWPLIAALASFPTEQKAALATTPVAVTEIDRLRHVLACNDAALRVGVRPGHSLNAAIALHPQLQVLERDPQKERSLLVKLAQHCQQYSSAVSLEEPDEVLIEIRGSLRLFGGLSSLMERVRSDLTKQGLSVRMTAAPTPESALWLARASTREVVLPRALRGAMDQVSIASLRWPPDIELRLWRFGIRSVGELLRLPRAGLARRIGANRLLDLDRAFGRHPSVRKSVLQTETFKDALRLDFEVTSTTLLEPLLRQSLQRLAIFLKQRQLCVGQVTIALRHRDRPDSKLKIALARATADTAHLQCLLHEKLHGFVLPAPVTDVVVRAQRVMRAQSIDRNLFSSDDQHAQRLEERQARLYEQLTGRLGEHSLSRLHAVADHRPERAQQLRPALHALAGASLQLPPDLPKRPLWLLRSPRPLRRHQLRPAVPPQAGPESLDSGWWDGFPVHRDYFVAQSNTGALLWIFRDRIPPTRWYVHGRFG